MRIQMEEISLKYVTKRLKEPDIPAIYQLCKGNPTFYFHLKTELTEEYILEDMTMLPPRKEMEDKYFFGFYQNGELTAVMDLIDGYPDADTAFIGLFIMDMKYQGRGIGSDIIEETMRYLKKAGFRHVRLAYVKGNRQSENFWKKNAFLPTGVEAKNDRYTMVVMQRELVE